MFKKIHVTGLALAAVLAAGATAADAGIVLNGLPDNGLHPNAVEAGVPSLQTLAQNPIASKADGN